jgi:hypothetical protein
MPGDANPTALERWASDATIVPVPARLVITEEAIPSEEGDSSAEFVGIPTPPLLREVANFQEIEAWPTIQTK